MFTPLCCNCGSYCRHIKNNACPCMILGCKIETEIWECMNKDCHDKWELNV